MPKGCNSADSTWMREKKGDIHAVIKRDNLRIMCGGNGYGVDCFQGYAPMVSSASSIKLAALACLLHLDLRCFDVEQAFDQSDFDPEIYL